MIKAPKFKIKKIKDFFKKLPKILGEWAFLVFLIFLFVVFIFGGIIFYKYDILIQRTNPQITETPLHFKEKTYENVLKIWQEKEVRFKASDSKTYPDPFRVD